MVRLLRLRDRRGTGLPAPVVFARSVAVVAQLAAYSMSAVGFLARPLGGLVFSHYGDLHGRKRMLFATLLLMGGSTTLVGLLPTYEMIGAWAPLLLIVLRFIQGFAGGGQWGSAALMAIENAPEGKRGLFGSFVEVGVPAGVVLANVAFFVSNGLMSPDQFAAWGWRVPFLLSVIVIGLAFYIQRNMHESREFEAVRGREAMPESEAGTALRRSPITDVVAQRWRLILLAGGAFIASNACFYVIITWVISYGTTALGLAKELMLSGIMIGSLCMIPALMVVAHISDRIGRFGIFFQAASRPDCSRSRSFRCSKRYTLRDRRRDCDQPQPRGADVRSAGGIVRRAVRDRSTLIGPRGLSLTVPRSTL